MVRSVELIADTEEGSSHRRELCHMALIAAQAINPMEPPPSTWARLQEMLAAPISPPGGSTTGSFAVTVLDPAMRG